MLKFSSKASEIRIPIKIGDGEFGLTIRRPTYQQQVEYLESGEPISYMLKNGVVGWDSIVDSNETPIAFTPERFTQLCESYPVVTIAAVVALRKAYTGYGEEAAKN